MEPVAREQEGNMEINATNGLLADIKDLNDELKLERSTNSNQDGNISNQLEDPTSNLEEDSSQQEEFTNHQEEMQHPTLTPSKGHTAGGGSRLDTTPAVPVPVQNS